MSSLYGIAVVRQVLFFTSAEMYSLKPNVEVSGARRRAPQPFERSAALPSNAELSGKDRRAGCLRNAQSIPAGLCPLERRVRLLAPTISLWVPSRSSHLYP